MKTKSALSYYGSDSEVAPQIANYLDGCSHVTIPFVGGASILPWLKARSIVANDLNDLAIHFYRTATDPESRIELIQRCDRTLSHPAEMELAMQTIEEYRMGECWDSELVAWAYWALCWVGRKGKGGTADMASVPSVRRTGIGGNNATRIRSAASDLEAWARHFERCEWECRDFRDLLPLVADGSDCGIYADPPWMDAGELYLHSFTKADHIELRNLLGRFANTKIIIRYGDHPFIRNLYRDFHIVESSSRTQANKGVGEIWILING
jgi:site-specific DNA-adenine methylase